MTDALLTLLHWPWTQVSLLEKKKKKVKYPKLFTGSIKRSWDIELAIFIIVLNSLANTTSNNNMCNCVVIAPMEVPIGYRIISPNYEAQIAEI